MLSPRPSTAIDTRRLRSFDGTEIAYHVAESTTPDAPWIVLAPGLGGSVAVWRAIIDYLRDRYRFVTWDPRGLHDSERPRPDRAAAYAVDAHVADLQGILAKERVDRAALVGWSTGAQVAVEAFSRLRGKVPGVVLIDGAAGRPLDAITRLSLARRAILPAVEIFRRAHALSPVPRRAMGFREAALWLRRLGLVRGTLDETTRASLTRALAKVDVDALLRNILAFGEHDARGSLARLDVPALIIAGDRDPLLPLEIAHQTARRIPDADVSVVRGGSHYAIVEYPDLVSLRLERFLRDIGLEAP